MITANIKDVIKISDHGFFLLREHADVIRHVRIINVKNLTKNIDKWVSFNIFNKKILLIRDFYFFQIKDINNQPLLFIDFFNKLVVSDIETIEIEKNSIVNLFDKYFIEYKVTEDNLKYIKEYCKLFNQLKKLKVKWK
jgi:hypothetical protein